MSDFVLTASIDEDEFRNNPFQFSVSKIGDEYILIVSSGLPNSSTTFMRKVDWTKLACFCNKFTKMVKRLERNHQIDLDDNCKRDITLHTPEGIELLQLSCFTEWTDSDVICDKIDELLGYSDDGLSSSIATELLVKQKWLEYDGVGRFRWIKS